MDAVPARPTGSPVVPDDTDQQAIYLKANYDDQGLFFSLILCACLLTFFVPLVSYLVGTGTLWLKRFYRPNHTLEPPPRSPTASSPVAGDEGTSAFPIHESGSPLATKRRGERGYGGAAARAAVPPRRKRLGISLPYRSSMFQLPSWTDWVSVEERLPHLEGALSPQHVHHVTPSRMTGNRSFVPLFRHRDRSGRGSVPATSPTREEGVDDSKHTPSATASAARPASPTPTTPLSEAGARGSRGSYGAVESTGRVHGTTGAPVASQTMSGDDIPRTPLDPQVALYTFTLKFFASLMFLGSCFTIWICAIASQDDYNEYMMVKADSRRCHRHNANETECMRRQPYCMYSGADAGCEPVAVPGLYDMTANNISPGSWRWWPVVLLNAGFCIVVVLLTVFYTRRVGQYARDVMANQMRHSLGYRVACVRGAGHDATQSVSRFSAAFLEERAYFVPNSGESGRGHPGEDSAGRAYDMYERFDCNAMSCLFSVIGCQYYTVDRRDAIFTQPGRVKQILFTRKPPRGIYRAIAKAENAMADTQDIVADEKAARRKIRRKRQRRGAAHEGTDAVWQESHPRRATTAQSALFSLGAPPSPSSSELPSPTAEALEVTVNMGGVGAAERDDASVPQAEATYARAGGPGAAGHGSAASSVRDEHGTSAVARGTDEFLLYTRTSMASCCKEVPAIPYYEKHLRRAGQELNRLLAEVPQQPTDSATFVIFSDARSAFEFVNLCKARFESCFSSTVATMAGPPGQVIGNNLLTDKFILTLRFLLVCLVYVFLVFFYSIPIGMLGSLENLSYVPGVGPSFSEYYVENVPDWLRNIINAYLPVLGLALFYVFLPDLMRLSAITMGAFNKAECDAAHLYLQYLFMVLTAVIFQAALQGGFAQLAFLVSAGEGRYITEFFVACVTPSKVSYFYAKVLMAIGFTAWNDLVDPVGIIKALLLRARVHVQRNYDALFLPCELDFPQRYSFDLMILSMGLLFHMTIPLLGLFVAVFFFVRYFTQRARVYDRYRPTVSPAHDCTDFTVSAQVLRSVIWLFCLAETGGVLLLSLRRHTGGVVVCSLTLATGFLLLLYVHLETRKWVASLNRAREFSRRRADRSPRSARGSERSPTQATSPAAPSEYGSFSSMNASPNEPEDGDDDAVDMDAYENLRFTLFDDTHGNPFIGHLLPRLPDISCRYQPKHQRLAPLDVDVELATMKQSVFLVERYWDEGMTWFEADVSENRNATTIPAADPPSRHGPAAREHRSDGRQHQAHDIVVEPSTEDELPALPLVGSRAQVGYTDLDMQEDTGSPLVRRHQAETEVLSSSGRDSVN